MTDILKFFSDNTVLSIVALLTLAGSLAFNFFQYITHSRINKIDLNHKIELKEIEIEETRERHREEHRQLEANYEGEIREREFSRVDARTETDRRNADNLFSQQRHEEQKLWSELSHLYALRGDKTFLLGSRTDRIKFAVRRFFSGIWTKVSKRDANSGAE